MPTVNEGLAIRDEYLTGYAQAQAEKQREKSIAGRVFMTVPTSNGREEGTYAVYPKAQVMKDLNPYRIPRADKAPVQFHDEELSSATFKCEEWGSARRTSERERANYPPGYDGDAEKVDLIVEHTVKVTEQNAFDLMDALSANVTLSGTAQWDSTAANPFSVIETGVESIRLATGGSSGVKVVMGKKIAAGIRKGISGSGTAGEKLFSVLATDLDRGLNGFTASRLTALLDVDEVIIADAVIDTTVEGTAHSGADLWNANKIWIVRTNPSSNTTNSAQSTFGKKFVARPFEVYRWALPPDGEAIYGREISNFYITGSSHVYVIADVLSSY